MRALGSQVTVSRNVWLFPAGSAVVRSEVPERESGSSAVVVLLRIVECAASGRVALGCLLGVCLVLWAYGAWVEALIGGCDA